MRLNIRRHATKTVIRKGLILNFLFHLKRLYIDRPVKVTIAAQIRSIKELDLRWKYLLHSDLEGSETTGHTTPEIKKICFRRSRSRSIFHSNFSTPAMNEHSGHNWEEALDTIKSLAEENQ